MNNELKELLIYLDLDLDLDTNQKIADHEDYDSLFHLDLITYISKHHNIEVKDSVQFCLDTSFNQLSQLICGK